MPDEFAFREVMGHFATGVTIVAARHPDGLPFGLTVSSVTSVSLDPLLVLVCLDRAAASHDRLIDGGGFAISVLSARDEHLARRFSAGERTLRFDDVSFGSAVTGSPVFEGALAWLDCEIRHIYAAGDHSIVVANVVACGAGEGDPLIFFRGDYRGIGP